jgi:hypothetical protein
MSNFKFGKPETNTKGITKLPVEGNPFMDNAPEDIKKAIKPVFKYMKEYANEAVDEVTKKANNIFAKSKKATDVVAKVPFGPSSLDNMLVRVQREVKARDPKTGREWTQPRISTKVKTSFLPGKAKLTKARDELLKDLNK